MIFLKRISTAPARNLKVRAVRSLVNERNLFGNSKIEIKSFQVRDFWKGTPAAPTRNLKARDVRPLASERNLFWIFKIEIKIFQVRDFLERDFHGANKEP